MQALSKYIYALMVMTFATHALAIDTEAQASIKLDTAIFEKFHFNDYVVKYLGVGHLKGKMASMEYAYCLKDGNEKSNWRMTLLQTNTLDPEITAVVSKSNLPNSLRAWASKGELKPLSPREKQELLALPSTDTLDRVIALWLWSRFDSFDGDAELGALAKRTWESICTKRAKYNG